MQKLFRFLKLLVVQFFADLCPMRAASLTFTTLLSIVPLVILTFYVVSFFPRFTNAGNQIEQFILTNFVASSAATISTELQNFVTQVHTFSWTNVVSLIFFELIMIYNIVATVNGVWHTTMKKHVALSFFIYLFFILVGPIVFSFLLFLSSYLTSLPLLSHFVQIDFVRKPFISISPFLIEWITFALFQWVMPSCRVYFRYAVIAGFITMILFEITKWGFVWYFHYFSTYELIYGALATIPIFFMWIYVSWLIIILGTLICQLLQTYFRPENT